LEGSCEYDTVIKFVDIMKSREFLYNQSYYELIKVSLIWRFFVRNKESFWRNVIVMTSIRYTPSIPLSESKPVPDRRRRLNEPGGLLSSVRFGDELRPDHNLLYRTRLGACNTSHPLNASKIGQTTRADVTYV
jgi:hypothetical protein